jgi:pyruvate/2-oxoacid:ferredoxin oxidoreductase alpha subunit
MDPVNFPARVGRLLDKFDRMRREEVRFEGINLDDADLVVVAYGSASRSAETAVQLAREAGIKAGLLRPITTFPIPSEKLADLSRKCGKFLVAEMSSGQMIEDVKLAVGKTVRVELVNTYGGVPLPAEQILQAVRKLAK